jgi:predicted dehydrogenase
MTPIRIGLIGAGIYARDAHVPAMKALGDAYEIVAIYSRTRENAESLAREIPGDVGVYTEVSEILARQNIDAVDILLPIGMMADGVEQALKSGKHVISEKPIAHEIVAARRLLNARQPDQVWMVAENWRYEASFRAAAEVIARGDIGKPLVFHWNLHIPILPGNKYYATSWRREGGFPGGIILDFGVHHAAALRMIMGEVAQVSALTSKTRDDLADPDTISAILQFESGLIGAYSATASAGTPPGWVDAMHIVGDKGALRVNNATLEVTANGQTQSQDMPRQGVQYEFEAFARAIRDGEAHRNPPEEAFRDLALVEAMFRSAETGRAVKPEKV